MVVSETVWFAVVAFVPSASVNQLTAFVAVAVSVMSPVLINETMKILYWAIGQLQFDVYLNSLNAYYSFFVPTNKALLEYIDPVSYGKTTTQLYRFYYEFENQDTTQQQCDEFTKLVDKYLRQQNVEYVAKRDSMRVHDPVGYCLVENSFEKFKAACIAEGARDGQFKMNLLMQDEKRHAKFKKLVKE